MRAGRNESPHLACARFHALEGLEVGKPKLERGGLAGIQLQRIKCRHFCSHLIRIDGLLPARHDIVVDAILDVGRRVGRAEYPLVVGVVFGEQQGRISVAMQHEATELGMRRFDRDDVFSWHLSQGGLRLVRPPGPGVAEPQRWQHVKRRRLGSAIGGVNLDQDVGGSGLRVLDKDVEIAVLVKDTSIE